MLARSLCAIFAFALYVDAFGTVSQVVDGSNFCVYLPPADAISRNIADSEWQAEAYCTGTTPQAINAGPLPDGFIVSAHYATAADYVQITGRIDPTKMQLNGSDEGGQMDIKAPKGSQCAGWQFYVNLIEPLTQTFCIRCCNDDRNCNRGISQKGCAYIIPGDYDDQTTSTAAAAPVNPATPGTSSTVSTGQPSPRSIQQAASPNSMPALPVKDDVVKANSAAMTSSSISWSLVSLALLLISLKA